MVSCMASTAAEPEKQRDGILYAFLLLFSMRKRRGVLRIAELTHSLADEPSKQRNKMGVLRARDFGMFDMVYKSQVGV